MDDELRRLGRDARAEVEADLDVGAAWAAHAGAASETGPDVVTIDEPSPARWGWALAAAATVVALVGGFVLLRTDDSIQTAQTPTSTAPVTTPPTAPPTLPATTETSPTTTNPATTTVAPTTTPPSTDLSILAVSFSDPPPPAAVADWASDSDVVSGESTAILGELGVLDKVAGMLRVVAADGTSRGVPLSGEFWPLAYGPGDVAYGLEQPSGDTFEVRLVAIALSGARAGEVVARSELLTEAFSYPWTPSMIGYGPTGFVGQTRDRGRVLLEYVDRAGEPIAWPGEPVAPSFVDDTETSITHDTAPATSWSIAIDREPGWYPPIDGPHGAMAGPGGTVVYATTLGAPDDPEALGDPPTTMPVVALLQPDGTGRWASLTDGWQFESSGPWGTLVSRPDAGRDIRQLGVLTDGEPGSPDPVAWWSDFRWEASRIARDCVADGPCTQLVVDAAGTTISYDPTTRTLSRHSVPPVEATLPDSYDNPYIAATGPDDVVYLGMHSPGVVDPVADLVAISLAPDDAGSEIRRWPKALDGSGDSELVATTDGLVVVGCCGPDRIRPAPDAPLFTPWVDRSGADVSSSATTISAVLDYPVAELWRGDRSWTIDLGSEVMFRGMPTATPTFDGGVLAVFIAGGGAESIVVRGWPDGTVEAVWADTWPAALEPTGVVLFDDGDRFARVQLFEDRAPYWNGARDIDAGGTGAVEFPGLNDALDTETPAWAFDPVSFAHAIAGWAPVNEVRTIEAVQTWEFGWTVTVTTANFFDDSVYGSRLVLDLTRSDLDGSFRLDGGTWTNVCQPGRGHQDFTPELCI